MIKETLIELLKMVGFLLVCSIPALVLVVVVFLFGWVPFIILCCLLVLSIWVTTAYFIARDNVEENKRQSK